MGIKIGGKKWKNFMAKLYGFGAAVVIVGAMFKIMHWPGAGAMLVVGLSTEAVIFIFSAFEPLHEDPDWSLVYPELAAIHGDDEEVHGHIEESMEMEGIEAPGEELTVSQQLDDMLEQAKIGPELLESLGSGLMNLKDQTEKLSNITDASVASEEYSSSLRSASASVSDLSQAYNKASEGLTKMAVSDEEGSNFNEAIQGISKNLSELNNIYELQLNGAKDHLTTSNNLYAGINQLMQNLNDSVEDTQSYKENIAKLSGNLHALNTVYGNMLTAMNVNPMNQNQG